MPTFVLKLNCPDAVGLVAKITGFVAQAGGNLIEAHQFTDTRERWFFIRLAFEPAPRMLDVGEFRAEFDPMARGLNAGWSIRDASQPRRMVVLVSREDHALAELLWRRRSGELSVEIPLVIGNHASLADAVRREGIPFEQIDFPPNGKEAAFRAIAARCEAVGAELIVMARFMQILPAWFCERFAGRVINIHHSFLPAFPGADPYRRAFERGVKLIGATCHYATEELDAGPIIEQEVVRVEHFHTIDDLKRHGRDCERLALARGVRFHLDDRVLVHGSRTVVFRD